MILAVWMEVWVMRLIMETMLSPVSSNHLLGSWTMPLGLWILDVVVGELLEGYQLSDSIQCLLCFFSYQRSQSVSRNGV